MKPTISSGVTNSLDPASKSPKSAISSSGVLPPAPPFNIKSIPSRAATSCPAGKVEIPLGQVITTALRLALGMG
ncbi:MAG: hypothetical protein V3V04_06375 [Rhizobiaceae bacterium]